MAQNNNQNLFLKNSNGIPILRQQFSVLENSSDASLSYEASEMFNTLIIRTGLTAGRTDTFPEASDILNIMGNNKLHDDIHVSIKNNSAETLTIDVPASIEVGNVSSFQEILAGDTSNFILVVSSDSKMEAIQQY